MHTADSHDNLKLKMKNIAKLTLFFTITFIVFFLAAIMLKFISTLIDFTKIIPVGAVPGEDVAEAAWKALPAALYLSILMALGYTSRRKMPIPFSIISLIALGFIFLSGLSLGIERAAATRPVLNPVPPIQAAPGLIITQGQNTIVLLKESSDIRGPRLVSIPGRPLIYQEVPAGPNNTILALPSISFWDVTPWFIKSVSLDFSLSAGELKTRLGQGYLYFAVYAFSLVLLLSSLRFLMELSQWPLANIFLGALIFRLVLALEIFLNTREINVLLGSFLGGRVPPIFITPLVFCTLGVLTVLYTLLTKIARSRRDRDD